MRVPAGPGGALGYDDQNRTTLVGSTYKQRSDGSDLLSGTCNRAFQDAVTDEYRSFGESRELGLAMRLGAPRHGF